MGLYSLPAQPANQHILADRRLRDSDSQQNPQLVGGAIVDELDAVPALRQLGSVKFQARDAAADMRRVFN
jgi:hypothetical protein